MAPDPAPGDATVAAAAEAALYAGPVETFVERRTALARELRQQKDKEGAARVGGLRRPTLGAWALDQVAHGEPDRIGRFLAVGDHLREALDAAVRGDAGALRTAQAEQRTAVDDVVRAAMAALADGGHAGGDTVQRRIADTLHAALVDEAVADELRAGRLVSEHEAPGFGMGLDLVAAAAAAAPARPPKTEPTAKAAPAATAAPTAEREPAPAATAKVSERQQRAQEEREAKTRREEAARAERERVAREQQEARERRAREAAALAEEADRLDQRAEELAAAADEAEAAARDARVAAREARHEALQARRAADAAARNR